MHLALIKIVRYIFKYLTHFLNELNINMYSYIYLTNNLIYIYNIYKYSTNFLMYIYKYLTNICNVYIYSKNFNLFWSCIFLFQISAGTRGRARQEVTTTGWRACAHTHTHIAKKEP